MPSEHAGPVPREALDYFRSKRFKVGFDYRDVWRDEHATAFTVAKAMKMDVLVAIHGELDRAIAEGRTFEQFQKDLQPRLEKLGWWGSQTMTDPKSGLPRRVQLGSPRRLKVIYRANLRTARAAGQFARAQRTKRALPYFLYLLGPSQVHREEHEGWSGLILPVDDSFWDTHFPPNGWGCNCYVRQITKREAASRGGVSKRPVINTVEWYNTRTGKVEYVPEGINPGWDTNPGKLRQGQAQRKLAASTEVYKQTVAAKADKPVDKAPVSAALDIKARGTVKDSIRRAVRAIDQVHDDGQLNRFPVSQMTSKTTLGIMGAYPGGNVAYIKVNPAGRWPELTMCHETGHALDHQVLGAKGSFASINHPALEQWRRAVEKSDAVKRLREGRRQAKSRTALKHYDYLLSSEELFARSYAQYIAVRSGDSTLMGQLDKLRGAAPGRQWEDDDFVEIGAAIDDIIQQKGWAK